MLSWSRKVRWAWPALTLVLPGPGALAASSGVDFSREVRPILSDNCFACHGPDLAKVKSGLRLDLREEALKPARSGKAAIIPATPRPAN